MTSRKLSKFALLIGTTVVGYIASCSLCVNATTLIDSISFDRAGQPIYDQGGALWSGADDFTGPAGGKLDPFVYQQYSFGSTGHVELDGTGHLVCSGAYLDVSCPTFDKLGAPIAVRGSTALINFSNPGLMKDEGGGIIFGDNSPVPDYVYLGLGHFLGQSFIYFGDESHDGGPDTALAILPISSIGSIHSIGLKLSVDGAGVCTPYFWLDSPDGILSVDAPGWERLGTELSQFDSTDPNHQGGGFNFRSLAAPVPEPSSIGLVAVCGLLTVAFLRRRSGKVD